MAPCWQGNSDLLSHRWSELACVRPFNAALSVIAVIARIHGTILGPTMKVDYRFLRYRHPSGSGHDRDGTIKPELPLAIEREITCNCSTRATDVEAFVRQSQPRWVGKNGSPSARCTPRPMSLVEPHVPSPPSSSIDVIDCRVFGLAKRR